MIPFLKHALRKASCFNGSARSSPKARPLRRTSRITFWPDTSGIVHQHFLKESALFLCTADKVAGSQNIERCKARGTAYRMPSEGRDMPQFRVGCQALHDLFPRNESPERHSTSQRLCKEEDIGDHFVQFETKDNPSFPCPSVYHQRSAGCLFHCIFA